MRRPHDDITSTERARHGLGHNGRESARCNEFDVRPPLVVGQGDAVKIARRDLLEKRELVVARDRDDRLLVVQRNRCDAVVRLGAVREPHEGQIEGSTPQQLHCLRLLGGPQVKCRMRHSLPPDTLPLARGDAEHEPDFEGDRHGFRLPAPIGPGFSETHTARVGGWQSSR